MVFDANEALRRFGESHTTVVLWRGFEVSHRQIFYTLRDAIDFILDDRSCPTQAELHVHRGGHDVLIAGDELARLVAVRKMEAPCGTSDERREKDARLPVSR